MHRHRRVVHGGGEREIAVAEAAALGEQHRPTREVEPSDADVAADSGAGGDDDGVALLGGVLLDRDGVGAGRQNAAGEDARRFTVADRALESVSLLSGARPHRDAGLPQPSPAPRPTSAVGPRSRPWPRRRPGLRAQRRDIRGQHAAVGLRERRHFRRQRFGIREHAGERLCDRHQRHGSLLRAVGLRLVGPDLPPRFSTTRMPSMRMPRSTAFTMS